MAFPVSPVDGDKAINNGITYIYVGSTQSWVRYYSASPINNLTATTDPTINDNATDGYLESSTWLNTVSGVTFTCVFSDTTTATWVNTSTSTFYFDDWNSLVAEISQTGSTYINKYCVVANANTAPSSGTYVAPNTITSPIFDGGEATYKILAQGVTYSVETQKRTITNPVITSVQNLSLPKPTVAGYYIFITIPPSDGLPIGISLGDIALFDGSAWSKFQSYAQASITVSVGITTETQVAWSKATGSWQQTSGLGYMSGYKTVNSGVTTGTIIAFVVGDNFNMGTVTSPNIPLKAGRTYELRAFTQIVASGSSGARFAFVNVSGGAEISSLAHGISYTTTFTGNAGSQPVAGGFYTPTVDTNLNFKCVSHTGTPELQFESFRIEVKQLK